MPTHAPPREPPRALEGEAPSEPPVARTENVPFEPDLQARIDAAAGARGLARARIISGAGHDAQELARLCPTGMVFVPGEHDGISHNPRELSTEAQCQNGVNVLLDVLLGLAEEPGP